MFANWGELSHDSKNKIIIDKMMIPLASRNAEKFRFHNNVKNFFPIWNFPSLAQ